MQGWKIRSVVSRQFARKNRDFEAVRMKVQLMTQSDSEVFHVVLI